jgi:hypothetical protein
LEIDKDENLKQWKTNASHFYDKENRNTRGTKKKVKYYRNKNNPSEGLQ